MGCEPMERMNKWLHVVLVVARLLVVALTAVAADTAVGDPLRGVVVSLADALQTSAGLAADPARNASSLSLLVLPLSARATWSV